MNEIVLEISAFVIALFCLLACFRKEERSSHRVPGGIVGKLKNRRFVYVVLLIFLMISAIAAAIDTYLETIASDRDVLVVETVNEVYFIFHSCLPVLFSLYIIDMTGTAERRSARFFALYLVPFVLSEILVLINPFTKIVYYIDSDIRYARGTLMWFMYIVGAFYVAFGLVFFLLTKKNVPMTDRRAMMIILMIATAGFVIQGLFSVKVELFFESVGMLCFLLLLEGRDSSEKSRSNSRISRSFIVAIALIFTAVIIMSVMMLYNAGTDQTDKIGEVQLNNLKGEMQQTLSDSENSLLRYSMGLEQMLNNSAKPDEIEKFIRDQQKYYSDLSGGSCFRVYAASSDWTIIPDFDMPEEYHAVERVWYLGAKKTRGQAYISEPYIDADTGNLCYTFSYLLSDGDTVAAMDYTLSKVQDIVSRMGESEDQFAMIVTDSGIVVGCSDEACQGEEISNVLRQYSEVFERVKASNEHRSFRTNIDGKEKTVFDSETENGWKLILVVDHGTLYTDIVKQMMMLGTIDFMMVTVIIAFYLLSVNNQEKAEKTLASTERFIAGLSGDIKIPLQEIIGISDSYLKQSDGDAQVAVRGVLDAGRLLQEKLDNLFSYSRILKENISVQNDTQEKRKKRSISTRYIRGGIIGIFTAASLIGLSLCLVMTFNWGTERVSMEAQRYDSEVTQWMLQKQSILGMFSDVIAADPEVLGDYDAAVKWLDDIAKNYNEMTFAYMANPYNKEHAIIMNNGWVPEPDYHVEERQWYIDTERSGSGYSISAPYFDAQTGLYCITFSRCVYSADGQFLGIFAIDCLLDKLIDVLDNSYTADSYAFMVDMDGTIINHPFDEYQISTTNSVNIEDTEYADAYHKGQAFMMRDHDGRLSVCHTEKSELSGFTVVVVQSWWSIYGTVLVVVTIFLLLITASVIGVAAMINRFTKWQETANEKLTKTAERAVAAEKAKSRFLAQMSHEIRTPINAVLGMNEMILRESSDKSIREYAGNIHSAGKNLLGLINSILDFSKIEEGKMEIIPIKYDTASMIESVINSVSKRASDKGLVFEAHIDSTLPTSLYGDDMRVSQVAVNLLTNAVKYTREGRVDLYIDGKHIDDNTIALCVRVKDTGIGIKEEDMEKLFESFTRLEENRNRTIEGTGLGMAIVNRLLDMMGSKLEVHSVYGEGSEFAFEVKQGIIDAEPIGDYEIKAREAFEHEKSDKYLYAPEARILVVDDNDMNLKVAGNLMKLNGIRPELVLSGAEALEKLKENSYDLIMLDHMMPEMDGIETLKKAKEQDLIPQGCTVIVLTANAVVGARETYIKSGFDDYLSKPIEVKSLESILGKYLPPEKVSYKSRIEEKTPENSAPNSETTVPTNDAELYRLLESCGIDTKLGLNYCGNDDSFYKEILRGYLDSSEMRMNELNNALSAGDINTYAIKVHALKSTSRTIGAAALSETAAELEKAANEDDIGFVKGKHDELLEKYEKVISVITAAGLLPETPAAEDDDDDEIMEFMPK